jgi:outer membrane lipoprotein carrier protein
MFFKKIILSITTFFFVFLMNTAFAQTPGDQLSNLLQNLQTFQADFSQKIQDKAGSTLSQSQGKMALKRPGLFRWETQRPNQQLIIADGKTIWIYDKDLEQITKQKQNASANTPGLLLSDSVSHLIKRFYIKSTVTNNDTVFELIPKSKEALFQSVQLVFDKTDLKQMILFDNLGQMTKISFSHIKANQELSQDLFHFRAPSHIEVVGE